MSLYSPDFSNRTEARVGAPLYKPRFGGLRPAKESDLKKKLYGTSPDAARSYVADYTDDGPRTVETASIPVTDSLPAPSSGVMPDKLNGLLDEDSRNAARDAALYGERPRVVSGVPVTHDTNMTPAGRASQQMRDLMAEPVVDTNGWVRSGFAQGARAASEQAETGSLARALGGLIGGFFSGSVLNRAGDERAEREREVAKAGRLYGQARQEEKDQREREEHESSLAYNEARTKALESGKWSKVKSGGYTYMVNSNNPTVGYPIEDANGNPLPPDQRKPTIIDSMGENGVDVNKVIVNQDGSTTPVTDGAGNPIVSGRKERVDPESGMPESKKQAGEDRDLDRASRESEREKDRQTRKEIAAQRSGMTEAQKRALRLKLEALRSKQRQAERKGKKVDADRYRQEADAVENELRGGTSGAQSQPRYAGRRMSRSKLPEAAKRRGVSEAEAERQLKAEGIELY